MHQQVKRKRKEVRTTYTGIRISKKVASLKFSPQKIVIHFLRAFFSRLQIFPYERFYIFTTLYKYILHTTQKPKQSDVTSLQFLPQKLNFSLYFQDTLLRELLLLRLTSATLRCYIIMYCVYFVVWCSFPKQPHHRTFLFCRNDLIGPFPRYIEQQCVCMCCTIMAANEERNETLAIKTTTTGTGAGRRSRAFFSRRDSALERFQAAVASAAASVSHSFNHPGLYL